MQKLFILAFVIAFVAAQQSCNNGQGVCQDSNQMDCEGGSYQTGMCPGARNIQCCIPSSGGGDTGGNGGNGGNTGSGTWTGLGVDVSDACNNWPCILSSGYTYAVVRAWKSSGTWDTDAPNNIAKAQAAGLSPVDVYMFPRPKGASGSSQATSLWNKLQQTSFNGTIWFDVEQESPYWSTTSANQQFFNDVISTFQSLGASVGIYTSKSQWTSIMGSSFSGGSSLPLWYSHYDNIRAFSDWAKSSIGNYGGWSQPTVKQYQGDQSICGCNTDFNWAP